VGTLSIRRVTTLVVVLVVVTGAFSAASSLALSPLRRNMQRSRLIDKRLDGLRIRHQRLSAAIRNVRSHIVAVQAAGAAGTRASGPTRSIDARTKIGTRAEARLRHVIQRLHRRIAALRQHRAALGVWFDTIGVFRRCPVPALSSRSDNFGVMVRLPKVPVHRHQGIDIIAPTGSPIIAPFDGVAHSGVGVLGGNTVVVQGALGWVYNAHLSSFSERSNGPVHAGDVIGYVGATGDAQGSHDHFEFHPSHIPSNWPASPFGYAVIGTAIDPNLLLDAVCL
jgi:murein DD-endopeptidase MepM/ murein hydrolase activator NlpD